jgi:hypothetical protein
MRPSGDPERIFDAFVKNAVADIDVTRNERAPVADHMGMDGEVTVADPTAASIAERAQPRGRRADPMAVAVVATPTPVVAPPPTFEDRPLPDWMNEAEDEKETTAEIVLLTKVKPGPNPSGGHERARAPRPTPQRSERPSKTRDTSEVSARAASAPERPNRYGRHDDTMQLEAALAVPDIATVTPPPLPVREGSEDGQIPAGELDRVLSDMMVLARYGHFDEVRARLEAVTQKYPEDVLLLRRVVEFHIELGDRFGAIESLFTLALRLFERRNVFGMRQALEQVLIIEPDNRRAYKLLGLLEQRPSTGTGG